MEEVNDIYFSRHGHKLQFDVAETYGEEVTSIRKTADLWTKDVIGYIGPQETCVHEGRMAAAFNLPMISYVSKYYVISVLFQAFSLIISLSKLAIVLFVMIINCYSFVRTTKHQIKSIFPRLLERGHLIYRYQNQLYRF